MPGFSSKMTLVEVLAMQRCFYEDYKVTELFPKSSSHLLISFLSSIFGCLLLLKSLLQTSGRSAVRTPAARAQASSLGPASSM